jgi:hypothetical protein
MARTSTSFRAGNLAAAKHLAQSPRGVRAIVQVRGRRLRRELEQRSERPLQRLAIDLEARLVLIGAYLDAHGGSLVTQRGKVRGCSELYLRLSSRLLGVYDRLGIGKLPPSNGDDDLVDQLMRGAQQ